MQRTRGRRLGSRISGRVAAGRAFAMMRLGSGEVSIERCRLAKGRMLEL